MEETVGARLERNEEEENELMGWGGKRCEGEEDGDANGIP